MSGGETDMDGCIVYSAIPQSVLEWWNRVVVPTQGVEGERLTEAHNLHQSGATHEPANAKRPCLNPLGRR